MVLPDDYGFVPGRSTETAVKLLKLAEENGIDPSTVGALSRNPDGSAGGGYQVPDELLEAYNEYLDGESDVIEPQNSDGDEGDEGDEGEGEQQEAPPIGNGEPGGELTGTVGESAPAEEPDVQVNENPEPPKSGAGSGIDHWLAFAKGSPAWDDADADATRAELIEKYATAADETPAE